MKTNHDGTVTLNAYDTWTSCVACGQRVTGDSIHTCSPQLKQLTDEEILKLEEIEFDNYCVDKESKGRKTATITDPEWAIWFARAILRKAQEK